jgi:ABC-type multidrug transport system ATPase subunit
VDGVISATGLVKHYGEVTALAGLDLEVPQGTVLGLLGPNGAGKTTTVKVLTTLLRPDAGTATIAGIDVVADPQGVRRVIGALRAVRRGRREPHRLGEPRHDRSSLPPGHVRQAPGRGPGS